MALGQDGKGREEFIRYLIYNSLKIPVGSTFKTCLALNHFVSPSPVTSHLDYCNLTPSGLPAPARAHFQPFLHQPPENLYKLQSSTTTALPKALQS